MAMDFLGVPLVSNVEPLDEAMVEVPVGRRKAGTMEPDRSAYVVCKVVDLKVIMKVSCERSW